MAKRYILRGRPEDILKLQNVYDYFVRRNIYPSQRRVHRRMNSGRSVNKVSTGFIKDAGPVAFKESLNRYFGASNQSFSISLRNYRHYLEKSLKKKRLIRNEYYVVMRVLFTFDEVSLSRYPADQRDVFRLIIRRMNSRIFKMLLPVEFELPEFLMQQTDLEVRSFLLNYERQLLGILTNELKKTGGMLFGEDFEVLIAYTDGNRKVDNNPINVDVNIKQYAFYKKKSL